MLDWQTVTSANDARFLVKGAELSRAIVPGTGSRFQVCELRTLTPTDYDREYAIRDAHTVTDQQVRDGIRPKIVHRTSDLDAALAWCANHGS